jgi:sensor histidine kinase YesM
MQTFAFKTVSIGSAILLVVFLTIWLTRLNIKKKSKEIRIRNELSRLQMNSIIKQFDPHFTFNVISSVGALIMDGKKNAAYNYVVTLSNLLRTVLVDGSIMVRTLSEELDFVKRYCELQKLRFKERLIYSFHINENINLQRLIPKMTIQTFVENSIKHGIENRIEGGEVFVRIEENNNTLEIIVSDNGVGRKIAGSLTSKREGYGLRTINGIFEFLNRINKVKAKIEIKDLDDGNNNATGTEVKITIPDDYDFELTASSGFN